MAKRQRKYLLEIEDLYGDTVSVELPFSLDFDVNKAIYSNICSASFTLYNLAPSTRKRIYKDLMQANVFRYVTFKAGYESDASLSQVFRGTIAQCYSYRQGVEFITIIEANSGSDFLANSYVTGALPSGTDIKDALLLWGASLAPNGKRYVGSFKGSVKRGTAYSAPPQKLIEEYASGKFFLDGDDILILNDGDYRANSILNLINAETGLLGSPQRETTRVVFDCLFEPRILMGQAITLESNTVDYFNGVFKVVGFHHTGTISNAVCGTAKTQVTVLFGSALVNAVGGV